MMKGNMVQTYIDLIARRKSLGKLDKRQIDIIVSKLQDAGMLPEGITDLGILKVLCETLYAVHFLAGENDLPLDDAYSKMLMHNTVVKEEIDDPVEYIFNKYRTGQLRKSASPIH